MSVQLVTDVMNFSEQNYLLKYLVWETFNTHLISHINFYFKLVVYCLVILLLEHSSQNFIFIFFYMNTCINVYVCVSVLVINILWKHTSGALCAGLWCNVFVKIKTCPVASPDWYRYFTCFTSKLKQYTICIILYELHIPIHEQKQLLRWNNFI